MIQFETVLQSCGVADAVATSYGGRNRLVSAEFARQLLRLRGEEPLSDTEKESLGEMTNGGDSTPTANCNNLGANKEVSTEALQRLWSDIEVRLLKGQKIQGLGTCDELMTCLHPKSRGIFVNRFAKMSCLKQ